MSVTVHGPVGTRPSNRGDGTAPDGALDTLDTVVATVGPDQGGPAAGGRPTPVRSPQALGRLIVYLVAFAAVAILGRLLDDGMDGVGADLAGVAEATSAGTGSFVRALLLTVAAGVVVLAVGIAFNRGGLRFATVTAVGTLIAGGIVALGLRISTQAGWLTYGSADAVVVAATALAAIAIARDEISTRLSRTVLWLVVGLTILNDAWVRQPVLCDVLTLLAGMALGTGFALLAGTPSKAPTVDDVSAALERAGLPVELLVPHRVDARASLPWMAQLTTGRMIFVKVATSEERSADLLFRVWRLLRLRRAGDGRPESTLRRAIEHEAFVATRASAVGVRTPALVGLGRLGRDGGFAAYAAVDGRTFDQVGDELTDPMLRAAWSMLQALRRAGIAHRDLRSANLLVDDDDQVWLVDFGIAELAATDQQLRVDVVELAASTAALVGVDRAVAAGTEVLGTEPFEDALPLVQRAATSMATSKALGSDGFTDLRRALIEATGAPEPDEPRLVRVRLKTVLMIVALGVALWILLPQVLSNGEMWSRLRDARIGWVAVALVASALTYLAASASLLGAVPGRVSILRTFVAQVANSFTNRITPASLGSLALNTRFLARSGSGTAGAATAVGLSATAGILVHVVLVVLALLWAGGSSLGDLHMPDPRTIAVAVAAVVGLAAIGLAVPQLRRRFAAPARESWHSVVEVAHRPGKLAMLFGGSAIVTILNLVVLVAALRAFDVEVAISAVAVVYLAGSAIGGAAPTPGGLGATEAALVAGLTATHVAEAPALAAVLLFRLATFWLPILPGWICFMVLQRRHWV